MQRLVCDDLESDVSRTGTVSHKVKSGFLVVGLGFAMTLSFIAGVFWQPPSMAAVAAIDVVGLQAGQADPLAKHFIHAAGGDGQIDALELQRVLTQAGVTGSYQSFSLETCRHMISALDRDWTGKMGFDEYKEMWVAVSQWKQTFQSHDADRSGTVEPQELHNAIKTWGYELSPQAVNIIVRRYSTNNRITFDDFIGAAIKLRGLTAQFQQRDHHRSGVAAFKYDDFIQVGMYL